MAKMNSPLHRVIDARRWDGELLLGRLFILFHAAFVDAGFLPAAAADPFLPKQLGATASTLSLRYLVPLQQLLAAVALRVRAYGRHVVFYVGPFYVDTSSVVSGAGSSDYLWACVDAFAAAPLLSGGLDGTARALRNDPLVAALWRELAQGLSCRVLREICGGGGALLGGTSFMSLPEDAKTEILARLGDGNDLSRVSATCRDLRRLVRDRNREFWKHIYDEAVLRMSPSNRDLMALKDIWYTCRDLRRIAGDPSRKDLAAAAMRIEPFLLMYVTEHELYHLLSPPPPPPWTYEYDPPELFLSAAATKYLDGLAEAERSRGKAGARRAMSWSSSGGGREKRRHHAGAVNSPSARYRWKHR